MTNIINPAIMLMIRFRCVKNPIIVLLAPAEMNEKISNGSPIPIPKNKKLRKLVRTSIVVVLTAKSTARDAGLHGNTIMPKNIPNKRELK